LFIVPFSPAYTVTGAPKSVLLPLLVDTPEVTTALKPLAMTVAVSPLTPPCHVFCKTSVVLFRVLAKVQLIASLFTGVKLKMVSVPEATVVPPAALLVQKYLVRQWVSLVGGEVGAVAS